MVGPKKEGHRGMALKKLQTRGSTVAAVAELRAWTRPAAKAAAKLAPPDIWEEEVMPTPPAAITEKRRGRHDRPATRAWTWDSLHRPQRPGVNELDTVSKRNQAVCIRRIIGVRRVINASRTHMEVIIPDRDHHEAANREDTAEEVAVVP